MADRNVTQFPVEEAESNNSPARTEQLPVEFAATYPSSGLSFALQFPVEDAERNNSPYRLLQMPLEVAWNTGGALGPRPQYHPHVI